MHLQKVYCSHLHLHAGILSVEKLCMRTKQKSMAVSFTKIVLNVNKQEIVENLVVFWVVTLILCVLISQSVPVTKFRTDIIEGSPINIRILFSITFKGKKTKLSLLNYKKQKQISFQNGLLIRNRQHIFIEFCEKMTPN